MNVSKKGPIIDPGKCRCCGLIKRCRLLNYEYESFGNREIYSEMFVDCFGLVLSHLDTEDSERLICATCVMRLRDACAFRQQVLQCEEQLLSANVHIHDENEENKIKVEIKQEAGAIEVELEPAGNGTGELMLNNHSDDDNREDVDMDSPGKILGTVSSMRDEPSRLVAKIRKRKAPNRLRRSVVGSSSAVKLTVNTSLQADMFNKLQRMKDKLNKKIRNKSAPAMVYKPKPPRPPVPDKEFNTLRNTLTIIENSYITPFVAMFSDYHCVYCREMFIKPDKLREHTLEHDPRTYQEYITPRKMALVDIERIDCRLCEARIDNIDDFKEHITTVHNKVIYKDVDCEFIKFKLTMGKLKCVECDKSFNFFQALKKHMAEHFGTYICDECGVHYFEERHLVLHKKTHVSNRSIEMFPCTECDKTFRSKNSRNFHIARIHKNEAAYPCNKCDEVFISYHMRYRHKMNVHGEKREFPCENCEKVYDSRKTLRDHYQRTHLQLLRHECTLCDKKFYLPSALRDHMTSHTGERLYRCDYCGKNYPRKKALKVHLQSHNTEKKYKCNLCPCAYTQANNFKNHMKSKHPMQPAYSEGYT